MSVLDRLRNSAANLIAAPIGATDLIPRTPRSGFMRGNNSTVMSGWRPALRETRQDIAAAWEQSVARATDLQQNSGWISGIIDQAVANTVGNGLRLQFVPDANALGMTPEAANKLARDVEQRFNIWAGNAEECDIEGRRNLGQMEASAMKHWFATGEVLAEFPWRKRVGVMHGTKVRLLPATRLSRRTENLRRIEQGVRMDADGYPIAYLAKRNHPTMGEVEHLVRARDSMGRKRVVHVFDGLPGTVRGISPLVPALHVAKQYDQLADASLMAHIIQNVFAFAIKSDEPTEDMLEGLLNPQELAKLKGTMSPYDIWYEAQAGYYDDSTIDVGMNARIAHLFPGQEMTALSASISVQNLLDHASLLLRETCRCAGLTYESGTGDYTGATYSSVRMATGEVFLVTMYRRKNIVSPFCTAAFENWLEEDIEAGRTPIDINRFHQFKAAICRCIWHGSPKPQADDSKTAKAHQVWASMGVLPDAVIAQELGLDIEDVYLQRQREASMRESMGLPEPQFPNSGSDDKEEGEEKAPGRKEPGKRPEPAKKKEPA